MPEVREVIAQITTSQVCEGFYTLEGNVLTMVQADGASLGLDDSLTKRTLQDGDNEIAIAKMLTKKIRGHFRGDLVEGFSRNIEYPAEGLA